MDELNQGMGRNYINKGFYYFNSGYIEKALTCFLYALYLGENNSELLNTTSLILFYLGDVNSAIGCFKLNIKVNSDCAAKKYIEELNKIKKYVEDFNKSLHIIYLKKYREVFEKLYNYYLEGCITEDGLKLIVLCCIKLKKYTLANDVMNKMHDMNKECTFYYSAKSYISNIREGMHKKLKMLSVSVAIVCLIISSFMGQKLLNKPKEIVCFKVIKEEADAGGNELAEFMYHMMEKDFLKVEQSIERIDTKAFNEEQKNMYEKTFLTYESVAAKHFYDRGLKYYKDSDYRKSAECFKKAYKYRKSDYLDRHITFFLAKSLKNIKDPLTLAYYDEFIALYKDGCYVEEALYDAALLSFENGDLKKAKKYAEMLISKNNKSIYVNKRIKRIINYRGD